MLQNHFRLARTLMSLRLSQPAYRAWKELRLRTGWTWRFDAGHGITAERDVQPRDAIPAVPLPPCSAAYAERLVAALDRGKLSLLNSEIEFAQPQPDWRLGPQSRQRLEAITLQYHEWLFHLAGAVSPSAVPPGLRGESAEQHFVFFLSDWLRRCDLDQAGPRSLAWNPYAIATRLGWWTRIWQTLDDAFWRRHESLRSAFLSSLWRQADYLSRNLEWDLRANHLLRDAVGLAWAGRCFRGADAERWLNLASKLAVAQADEQILPDGGHFERSPMYHLEVLHDWHTLAALLPAPAAQRRIWTAWSQMAEFATWMQHPSGETPQFNDAALRRPAEHLVGWTPSSISPLNGGRHFASTGLIVWHGPRWSVFFDVGEIGPDVQPGHAHADTLTLECSFAGRRLFVDPGCFGYDHDERRLYDRSTAAHNTVEIDGQDSSEVWHIFRVGRRAMPSDVHADFTSNGFHAAAEHDGYDHLPGRPRHRRELSLDEAGGLQFADRITGSREHAVCGGFLLAPEWQIRRSENGRWQLENERRRLDMTIVANRPIEIEHASRPLHPDFGIEIDTSRIEWRYRGELPLEVCTRVTDADEGQP